MKDTPYFTRYPLARLVFSNRDVFAYYTNTLKYFRDFSKFNRDLYLSDIETVDFNSLISTDSNESMNRFVHTMQYSSDEHAPLHRMSNTKFKQTKNPGLLKRFSLP